MVWFGSRTGSSSLSFRCTTPRIRQRCQETACWMTRLTAFWARNSGSKSCDCVCCRRDSQLLALLLLLLVLPLSSALVLALAVTLSTSWPADGCGAMAMRCEMAAEAADETRLALGADSLLSSAVWIVISLPAQTRKGAMCIYARLTE